MIVIRFHITNLHGLNPAYTATVAPTMTCRPLAPGTYKLTAIHEGYQPMTAEVVIPTDGSGTTHDFKLTAVGGAKSWEQQLSISTHPMLRHVALRTHHLYALAFAGLLLCGVGGVVLLRVLHGRPLGLWKPQQQEYQLASRVNGAMV